MTTHKKVPNSWREAAMIGSKYYQCGYCSANVASNTGYFTAGGAGENQPLVYICSGCGSPTFFWGPEQTPYPALGSPVAHLPEDINNLYEEARRCSTVHAYTSAVLTCRKLIMHIAVEKQAPENNSFVQYIDYLANKGYVPPDGKVWADRIRTQGNEANHAIVLKSAEDAREVLDFVEMLLRFVYEFPNKARKSSQAIQGQGDKS